MGFSFCGFAINKVLKISDIETLIKRKLTFDKITTFEDALGNRNLKERCDIYFTSKGTLIFISSDVLDEYYNFENNTVDIDLIQFGVQETSMIYYIDAYRNNKEYRSFMERDGKIEENHGTAFESEINTDSGFDIVLKGIKQNTEVDIDKIELSQEVYRYKAEDMSTSNATKKTRNLITTMAYTSLRSGKSVEETAQVLNEVFNIPIDEAKNISNLVSNDLLKENVEDLPIENKPSFTKILIGAVFPFLFGIRLLSHGNKLGIVSIMLGILIIIWPYISHIFKDE